MTDEQNFDASLNAILPVKEILQKFRDCSHLRAIHKEVGGRDAALLTGLVEGAFGQQRYVGVLWQTTRSPPKVFFVILYVSLAGDFFMHR